MSLLNHHSWLAGCLDMSLPLQTTVISSNAQWNPLGFPRAVPPGEFYMLGLHLRFCPVMVLL